MIQHDNFWPLVSQKVNVFRSDPCSTTENSISLADGREVPTDILLCGTGWNSTYPFFSSEQASELGLPHDPSKDSPEDAQSWAELMEMADRQIMRMFPILATPPADCKPIGGSNLTPARLYNGIASLNDPSVVFLGRARVSNNFRTAEAQAIWATAYWDGNLKLPPFNEAQREVAYMNAFSRRRYPSRGFDGVNFFSDLVWYTDKLVSDVGLTSHRKGWWEDPEEPCLASDSKDCEDEYLAKYLAKES
jgi:dimethylaniline monooxygenase (N-oxide forming)